MGMTAGSRKKLGDQRRGEDDAQTNDDATDDDRDKDRIAGLLHPFAPIDQRRLQAGILEEFDRAHGQHGHAGQTHLRRGQQFGQDQADQHREALTEHLGQRNPKHPAGHLALQGSSAGSCPHALSCVRLR